MQIIRTGTWCTILEEEADRAVVYAALERPFSFRVAGAEFSEAYRTGQWDGRIRLVKRQRHGGILFPAGLWDEALQILAKAGYTPRHVDARMDLEPRIRGLDRWMGPELRDYQRAAVRSATKAGGGILRLPVRAGKTMIAAALIKHYGQKALFVVPSDMLVQQTVKAMQRSLPDALVTVVGGGDWDTSGDVVVATIQTLQGNLETRKYQALAQAFPVVFIDEVHHTGSTGDEWREAALGLNARHKFGLSATVELGKRAQDAGSIWLRAVCGSLVYSIGISDLIEMGFLVRPMIRFVQYSTTNMDKLAAAYATLYSQLITKCEARNAVIVAEAQRYARDGRGTLVDVAQIGHTRHLADQIARGLPPGKVAVLTGSSSAEERVQVLAAFRTGQVRVIVGTIMGEGVDVPEIEVVINAEGGKAKTSTIQRLRNLTLHPGKTEAIVVEMADVHHPKLRDWTLERLQTYRKERAFNVVMSKVGE